MRLRELLSDDDAVSPVIGVILMVAITVILAAVIAAFVLGLGDTNNPGPQVTFDYDYDGSAVDVQVQSGDSFEAGQVTFSGDSINEDSNTWGDQSGYGDASVVSAGDSVNIGTTGDDWTLDLVWEPASGGDSSIIGSEEGPAA